MTRMRIFSFVLATATLFAHAANGQASVYGTVALTNFGFSHENDHTFTYKGDTAAISGGAFYNFPIHSRLTAGIDARALYSPGSKGGTSAAVALRIGFVPVHVRLRPYLQVGGGVASSVESIGQYVPERYTSPAAEFLGGVDVRLTRCIDLRAVELGGISGSSNSNSGTSNAFLNSGIVYHFVR